VVRKKATGSFYIIVVTAILLLLLPQITSANVPQPANLTVNDTADENTAYYCVNPCAVHLTTYYHSSSMPRWINFTLLPPGNNTNTTLCYGCSGGDFVFGVGNWTVAWSSTNGTDPPPYYMNTTVPVFINVSPAAIPKVSFISNTTGGSAPLGVLFDDTSTEATEWNWSFTNTTGNATQVWFSQNHSPIHSFGVGNWSIILTASNLLGSNTSSNLYEIGVFPQVIPNASFTANATAGMVSYYGEPVMIALTDTSSGFPTSWNWSVTSGDGNVSNNTVYYFSMNKNEILPLYSGSWLVGLTATNSMGSNTSPLLRITISPWSLPVNQQQYFTPHKVRFECHDYLGAPIVGMNVSVIGVESSLGSLDWVPYLFGLNLNDTPILNTTMTATTGSDGSVVFIMIETEKYELHYTYPAKAIDERRYYYPKEDSYLEVFWTESVVFTIPTIPVCGSPSYSYTATPNGSYVDVRSRYTDCSNRTANLTFYVQNAKTKQTLYTVNTSNPNSVNVSYPVPAVQGATYHYGITGKTTTGAQVYQDSLLTLNASQWKYNPLGAENGNTFALWFYNLAAVAFLVLFGFIFGRWSIKTAVVVVPVLGLYFSTLYMGWLQTSWLLVTTAVVLGVMVYLRFAEEESQL
jgi:hypothetical protein